jgi:hypothetical protein
MQSDFMRKEIDRLDPVRLMRAIITVYERMSDADEKPGSMAAEIDTRRSRPAIVDAVRDCWCDSKDDHIWFPFHDDYVIRFWATYRRCSREKKAACRLDLGLHEVLVDA